MFFQRIYWLPFQEISTIFVSGTSFASAVASGLVSLAVQKGKLDIDNISKTFEPFSFEVTCPR